MRLSWKREILSLVRDLMPTRLIIMRHANSHPESDSGLDHDRPLNERGLAEVPQISQDLIDRDWVPDTALISSSKRTQETFALMMDAPFEIRPEIYLAGLDTLLPIATGIEEGKTTLMLGTIPAANAHRHTVWYISSHFHSNLCSVHKGWAPLGARISPTT